MTQPPPPPNQPPQQPGFGPPQDPAGQQPEQSQQPEQPSSQQPEQPSQPPAQQPPAQPPTMVDGPDLGKAPQPQPGYGYPQAPQPPQTPPAAPAAPPAAPQGPGYGYPQQPQPPQPPAGYGYPGQQPSGPYGQPQYGQPGYGQPGYGYPQATVPTPPQPGGTGGGRKINAQLAIIVSAVVAIALIIGGGVWYASSGKDDGKKDTAKTGGKDPKNGGGGGTSSGGKEKAPADPKSRVLFQLPQPKLPKGQDSITTAGSWVTDTVYAKSGIAEIVGYDRDKGTKLWTIDLPGPVCTATHHVTEDGKTAIVYKPDMPTKAEPQSCTEVAAIDLKAGKKLWNKTAKTGTFPIRFSNVTISGTTVAAGSTSGGAAWDITSGKQLWAPKNSDSCYDAGYGGGPKMVAVRKCGSFKQRQLHIQTIDPKSGKVISEYKMDEGIEYAAVVSTDPLVVAADVNESAGDGSGISDFFSIDNKTGKLRERISAPGDDYAAKCDGISEIEKCSGLAVGNDRLYIATEEHESGTSKYGETNEIVAFDLGTGKQTGQRADAGDDYTITPLRMDGGNILAYKRPPYDKGGQIVSIDGGTFKQTVLLENPATRSVRDVETRFSPQYSEILFSEGRLFMSSEYASDFGSSDSKRYLAIAFGTN